MRRALALICCAAFLAVGIHGAYSYVNNYLVYRGFPPPTDPSGVVPGKLVRVSYHSNALGRQDSYLIYLPAGYAAAAARGVHFPVLYLLHGTSAHALHFINAGKTGVTFDELLAQHRIPPYLIVMPEAEDGTFVHDTEWANTAHGNYESAVLDLVKQVDARWSTIPKRGARGIAGLSMGGYAAVNIWLHHPNLFSVAESWSGYYVQTRSGVFTNATPAALSANSPYTFAPSQAQALRRDSSHVLLYGGVGDRYTLQQGPFAALLGTLGISVEARVVRGPHSWALWRRQMPLSLTYAGHWLARR